MTLYEVDYYGKEIVTGKLTVEANDDNEAEAIALERVYEDLPNLDFVSISDIREKNAR